MRNRIPGRHRPWAPLLSAIAQLAGGQAELLRHVERPWASVTFSGTRHTIALAFTGAEAVAAGEAFIVALPEHEFTIPRQLVAGEAFIVALPEHEFTIPRQLVADAAVIAVEHEALPEPKLTIEAELLLLEEA